MSKRRVTKHNRPTVTDTTDENQLKQAAEGEKDRERDLAFILSQPRGRRWLYDLIYTKCHVGQISHVPRDTHSTAFNEGGRAVGEALLEEVRSNHHAFYITMLEENDNVTD